MDILDINFETAQKAVLAAEQVALNSESNDQELSLFRAFFDSAVALLTEDKMIELAKSLADDVRNEIAHEPSDMQAEHVEKLNLLVPLN